MEKISINKNGLGIFKTAAKSDAAAKSPSTNPFGISFKGNVIQADVFESSSAAPAEGLKEKVANQGKLFVSSIVGGINSFNSALKSRMDSVISFGRRVKENVTGAIDKANNIDVGVELKNVFDAIYGRYKLETEYSVKNLTKRPVSELETMLRDELSL